MRAGDRERDWIEHRLRRGDRAVPGGMHCRSRKGIQRDDDPHPGIALAVTRVETVEVPPRSAWYLDPVPRSNAAKSGGEISPTSMPGTVARPANFLCLLQQLSETSNEACQPGPRPCD